MIPVTILSLNKAISIDILTALEPHCGCTTKILKHHQTVTFISILLYEAYLEAAY